MSKKHNFAVFILSHGRPDKVITYKTLRKHGYTGRIFIICDDEDKTLSEYKKKYKDEIIVFSKSNYEGKFDKMDNFSGNKVIVYARNACYDIARSLGLDYFLEYEDDYTSFLFRKIDGPILRGIHVKKLDLVLKNMIDCLKSTKSSSISFAQGGDFIGGASSVFNNNLKRKVMNTFVFKVNKDSKDDLMFIGRMNDDVNTYLTQGKMGKLFFQITDVCINQLQTQSNSGGNTEAYKKYGTYVKSFYSVMAEPSCCKISLMGSVNKRIHHSIKWMYAVPKILDQKWKK